jgi:hypothetical protein
LDPSSWDRPRQNLNQQHLVVVVLALEEAALEASEADEEGLEALEDLVEAVSVKNQRNRKYFVKEDYKNK